MSWGTGPNNANQTNESPPFKFDMDVVKILQHQYDKIIELYKYHSESILKADMFLYAITGAILSYYLSTPNEGANRFALIFPCMVNLVYGSLFCFASTKVSPFQSDLKAIVSALQLISYPDIMFLRITLLVSGVFHLVIAVGLSLIPAIR